MGGAMGGGTLGGAYDTMGGSGANFSISGGGNAPFNSATDPTAGDYLKLAAARGTQALGKSMENFGASGMHGYTMPETKSKGSGASGGGQADPFASDDRSSEGNLFWWLPALEAGGGNTSLPNVRGESDVNALAKWIMSQNWSRSVQPVGAMQPMDMS